MPGVYRRVYQKAREYFYKYEYDKAWQQLTHALHAIQDSTSPAHTDKNGNPIVWDPPKDDPTTPDVNEEEKYWSDHGTKETLEVLEKNKKAQEETIKMMKKAIDEFYFGGEDGEVNWP